MQCKFLYHTTYTIVKFKSSINIIIFDQDETPLSSTPGTPKAASGESYSIPVPIN
jgi:hypothetical protein